MHNGEIKQWIFVRMNQRRDAQSKSIIQTIQECLPYYGIHKKTERLFHLAWKMVHKFLRFSVWNVQLKPQILEKLFYKWVRHSRFSRISTISKVKKNFQPPIEILQYWYQILIWIRVQPTFFHLPKHNSILIRKMYNMHNVVY